MTTIPGVSAADLAAVVQQTALPTQNATIRWVRPGVRGADETEIQAARRVTLGWPNTHEKILAGGAELPVTLADVPDTPYLRNDLVIITLLDGHTTLPEVTQYRVTRVEQIPDPGALTACDLLGEGAMTP